MSRIFILVEFKLVLLIWNNSWRNHSTLKYNISLNWWCLIVNKSLFVVCFRLIILEDAEEPWRIWLDFFNFTTDETVLLACVKVPINEDWDRKLITSTKRIYCELEASSDSVEEFSWIKHWFGWRRSTLIVLESITQSRASWNSLLSS